MEKGPAGVNGETLKAAKHGRQDQVTPDASMLEPLFGLGFEFLELHAPETTRETKAGKVVKLGKAPIHKRWTTAPAGTDADAREWLEGRRNVGVRLRACDLVIDVDPRNGGDIEALEKALKVQLRDLYPYVVTGSDGLHIYMAKPAGLRISGKLDGFPGIEFKTQGTQVVAPGSVHPDTGRRYEADILADFRTIAEAPGQLLGMLEVQDIVWPAEAGRHEPEELETMLSGLDVHSYADQDRWLELMMACHFATSGAGREEFVLWSIGDADYAHDEEVIRHRWDSLHLDKAGSVTERTLYKALHAAGKGELIPRASAADDFADVIGDADTGDLLVDGDAPKTERHFVDEMNDRYCGVLEGGKFRIFREFMDTTTFGTPRRLFARLTRADFLGFHEHDRVMASDGPGKSKAELWLKSPKRRTYEGLIMAPEGAPPGMLNLWKGWAVEAKPGDWSKTRALIYDVLASGDRVAGDYIVRWMAYLFQKPHLLPQVALVFRGGEGVGKGTLGRAIMDIVGTHGLTVSSTDQFAGRFDAHLRDCIFLFADEALWGGDKQAEGKLKQLITEPVKTYEAKGVDASSGRNLVHLMMASNNEWVAPAGPDARRFAVFDVSDARKQDRAYFGAINEELYQEGGLSAMLDDLLSMDLGNWRPYGNVPRTEGRSTQKLLSLDPMPRWWFKALEKGSALHVGLWDGAWDEPIVVKAGQDKDNVLESLQDTNPRRTFTKKALAQFLARVGVNVHAQDTKGNRIWLIPPLPDARKAFGDWLDEDLAWED